ncbi:thiol-disulfide oxidoreductase DCC family protein [Streptomyces sp. CBMA29]|uniref:thiol-disulfide oxidoreductase DCC family protein n=1 Tax=Streptomyces sp. CBMA29 TaxID=1896314 RepID=UPI001661C757|nr:DCC1-like thiol-disulfide oxidoreductase family protein [Streptomyces sp. CBMA29]
MTRLTQSAVTAPARPPAPRPPRPPVRRLTVLYDPACRLCAFVRDWLIRQRQLVKLDMVPVGSPEAVHRFPGLDHAATGREITVVGDSGQLYRGDSAWVVCLWALADHRAFSHTLATPAGRRLARAAVLTAAKYRERSSKASAPTWFPERNAAGAPGPAPVRSVPGWTYDKATGWTQSDPGAPPPRPAAPPAEPPADPARGRGGNCADGCAGDG